MYEASHNVILCRLPLTPLPSVHIVPPPPPVPAEPTFLQGERQSFALQIKLQIYILWALSYYIGTGRHKILNSMEEQFHEFNVLLTFSWKDYGIKSQKLNRVVSVGWNNVLAISHSNGLWCVEIVQRSFLFSTLSSLQQKSATRQRKPLTNFEQHQAAADQARVYYQIWILKISRGPICSKLSWYLNANFNDVVIS